MNPGSEPVLLDLEKLFLLSDSMENHDFSGKNGKAKIKHFDKKSPYYFLLFPIKTYLGPIWALDWALDWALFGPYLGPGWGHGITGLRRFPTRAALSAISHEK